MAGWASIRVSLMSIANTAKGITKKLAKRILNRFLILYGLNKVGFHFNQSIVGL
jgi:hypothetical protein